MINFIDKSTRCNYISNNDITINSIIGEYCRSRHGMCAVNFLGTGISEMIIG